MDAIGKTIIAVPTPVSLPKPRAEAAPLPKIETGSGENVAVDVQQADQQRRQAVEQAVQSNPYVISDTRFTIFKDTSGQYVTRITSLRDGRVTYVPEPALLQRAQTASGSTVNVKA